MVSRLPLPSSRIPRTRRAAPQDEAAVSNRLSLKDEQQLARRALGNGPGAQEARNQLVMANYGLIHMVASAYRRSFTRYEDLVQEGAIGLLRAAETFDPERGVRFGTYAVYWIRSKVQRFLQAQRRESNPLMAGVDAVLMDDGRRHIPRASVVSLETPANGTEDRSYSDVVSDPDAATPEELVRDGEVERRAVAALWDACKQMRDPRVAVIVEKRILAPAPETLSQVGRRLNLSREGARILENRVIHLARARMVNADTRAAQRNQAHG